MLIFSLVNIFKELASDIDGFTIPNHGNLTGWAKQGRYTTGLANFDNWTVHL